MLLRKLFFAISIIAIGLVSCSKNSDDVPNQDTNTWTFKAEGTTYYGDLFWDPILNPFLQGNDSYTFGIIGGEENSDNIFNILISLADTTFTETDYQSGAGFSDYLTSMNYRVDFTGDAIYESRDNTPGAIMNYKIESYNATTRELVLTFSGNAFGANGGLVAITEGKVVCLVEKL